MKHEIIRHRHETRRRTLSVAEKQYLTPAMIRVVLEGEDLADFVSLGADDHVKLFLPHDGSGQEQRRDYTPRAYDREARRLTLDFAVHEAGPATRWAIGAQAGDTIEIGGPRGSAVVSPTFDWWLLVGDETALPAIGRRIEDLPAGVKAVSVVAVASAKEQQTFETAANHTAIWAHRPAEDADDPSALLAVVRNIALPEGDGFVWIAAETTVARALRDHLLTERGHPREWSKAAGYWRKGEADSHGKLTD
jgi:NADPH-dependent ferric siderophore reductase